MRARFEHIKTTIAVEAHLNWCLSRQALLDTVLIAVYKGMYQWPSFEGFFEWRKASNG